MNFSKKTRLYIRRDKKDYACSLLYSVFFILIIASSAVAERLSLKQAIHIALNDSHDLKAYSWTIEDQKNDVSAARGHFYPRVNIEERYIRTDSPTYGFMAKLNQERFSQEDFLINKLNNPDDISDFQTALTIEQPLFVPKVNIGLGISKNELEARKAEYKIKKDEKALTVVKMFLGIQTAREHLKAAQKGLEDALEHKRLASLRNESGTGLYSDMLRTEVEVKKAESDILKIKGNIEVSKRALGLALGKTEAVDVLGEKISLPVTDLTSYLKASENRQDLEALRLRYENSREGVKLEKTAFLPEMGIRGSYQFNDHTNPFAPEGESYMLMGFLRWNLFDASKYSKIKKAKANKSKLEEDLLGLNKMIIFKVHEAYTRVMEKEQNLLLSSAIVDEAQEALRLVRVRYENSLASMVDLLDTQVMLNNSRAGLITAESDYISSIADLYYQSGILLNTLNQDS